MITWLQDTFGKHHRMLLGALLVVIIGSFVFYGVAGNGSRGSVTEDLPYPTATGSINLTDAITTRDARDLASFRSLDPDRGRAVSPEDIMEAARVVAYAQKHKDYKPDNALLRTFSEYVEAVEQLAAADALGIPEPAEKDLAAHIRKQRQFAGPGREFNPAVFKQISNFALDRLHLDKGRIQKAIVNEWRIARLLGAIQPDDAPALDALATRLTEVSRAKWTISLATFPRDGFTATIAADDKALAAFYETVKESHRVPKRIKLRYARLDGVKPDLAAKPVDDELIALAARRKDLFPLYGSISDATFLIDNRTELETRWRQEKAAEQLAANLSGTINAKLPIDSPRPATEAIDTILKDAGLTIGTLPAYGEDSLPDSKQLPVALLQNALSLSPKNWRTGTIPYGDAVFVMILDEEIPSRIPALDEVRARVESERVTAETDRLHAEAAKGKALDIATAVKAGKSFAEAASAAGLKVERLPEFDRQAFPDNLRSHETLLENLATGAVSPALTVGRDKVVVHIESRVPPTVTKDDAMFLAYRRLLGTAAARCSAQSLTGITD